MKRTFSKHSDAESTLFRTQSLDPSILWREASLNAFQSDQKPLLRSMTDAADLLCFLPSLPSLHSELKRHNDESDLISFWPSASDLDYVLMLQGAFSLDISLLEGCVGTLPDLGSRPPSPAALPFSFPSGFVPLAQHTQASVRPQPEVVTAQAARNRSADGPPQSTRQTIPRLKKLYLYSWIDSRFSNPYATDDEKEELSLILDLTPTTIFNFFINARTRTWKPQLLSLFDSEKAGMERVADAEWKDKIKLADARREPALVVACLLTDEGTRGILEAKQKAGEAELCKLAIKLKEGAQSSRG